MSDGHKPQPIWADHNKHWWSNVHNPQPILPIHDQCLMADAAFRWPTFLSQSTRALDNGVCDCTTSLSPSRCAHAMTYACKPWLMLPLVDRYRLLDVKIPHLMHGKLGVFNSIAWIQSNLLEGTSFFQKFILNMYKRNIDYLRYKYKLASKNNFFSNKI